MEVIETPLYFKATCVRCATVVKYDMEDVQKGSYYDEYTSYIVCPNCKHHIEHCYHNAVYPSDAIIGIDLAVKED